MTTPPVSSTSDFVQLLNLIDNGIACIHFTCVIIFFIFKFVECLILTKLEAKSFSLCGVLHATSVSVPPGGPTF